jgi:LysR family transcriptional regulator, regulator for metE and metH
VWKEHDRHSSKELSVNLDVRSLELVLAIHEESGVTRASERLNVTQSALSHQLRDIEDRLRTPLFLRVRKRMIITPAGEAVVRAARRVLQDVAAVEEEIRMLSDETRGTIRLSTQCYTCYHWLPVILRKFGKRYPAVEIRIDVDATRHTLRALLEGRIDVAIINTRPDDKAVQLTPLFEDELLLVVPEQHPLSGSAFVRPVQLASEHFILHTLPSDNGFVQNILKPAGVTPARCSQVELTEAIVELVRAGIGVTVMADWAIRPYERRGGIRTVPVSKGGVHRQWYAATLRQERTPPYRQRFIETLRDMAAPPGTTKRHPSG